MSSSSKQCEQCDNNVQIFWPLVSKDADYESEGILFLPWVVLWLQPLIPVFPIYPVLSMKKQKWEKIALKISRFLTWDNRLCTCNLCLDRWC